MGRGGGQGAKSYNSKEAWSSINHSILLGKPLCLANPVCSEGGEGRLEVGGVGGEGASLCKIVEAKNLKIFDDNHLGKA